MLDLIANILGAALTLLACYGAGRALWRWHPPSGALAFATGAAAFSLLLFLLLAAGLAHPLAIAALTVACALLVLVRRQLPRLRPVLWAAPIVLFSALYLVYALAPDIQPDAITYHRGLPLAWLRNAGFGDYRGFYDLMPLGAETLFAAAFSLLGSPEIIHLGFLLLTVPLILDVARRLTLPDWTGWTAAALYVCAPVTGVAASSAYTDAVLVFYIAAVFDIALRFEETPSLSLAAAGGLCAGFCYAVKFTGLVALPPLLWVIARRNRRAAVLAACCSLAGLTPWMLRALLLTGNPLAPLANSFFPNGSFHIATEQTLSRYLRSYGGIRLNQIPWALTTGGQKLQGLLGPVFLLAPLSLFALRTRAGRVLLAVAAWLAIPWALNVGTRFLLPSVPWLALALASVLSQPLAVGLVILHCVLSWPAIVPLYADQYAWRLKDTPWRAALRLQVPADYLRETVGDYAVAEVVRAHVPRGERMLDLYGVPYSYAGTVPVGSLPSSEFDNLAGALELAARPETDTIYEAQARWPLDFTRALRVRLDQPPSGRWSVNEIELTCAGERMPASAYWTLDAWPNPWDAPHAVDRNDVSRWNTWQKAEPGMFVEVRFDKPIPLDGATVVFSRPDGPHHSSIYIQQLDRQWRRVADTGTIQNRAGFSPRLSAMRFVKRSGIRYLLISTYGEGFGVIGKQMAADPSAWALDKIECPNNVCLFQLR